jgi:hypothetical protein
MATRAARLEGISDALGDTRRLMAARMHEQAQRETIAARVAVKRADRLEASRGRPRADSEDEWERVAQAYCARAGAVDLGDA